MGHKLKHVMIGGSGEGKWLDYEEISHTHYTYTDYLDLDEPPIGFGGNPEMMEQSYDVTTYKKTTFVCYEESFTIYTDIDLKVKPHIDQVVNLLFPPELVTCKEHLEYILCKEDIVNISVPIHTVQAMLDKSYGVVHCEVPDYYKMYVDHDRGLVCFYIDPNQYKD